MFAASKTASVSGGYQISRSLRFNRADSAYLTRTPASTGNRTTWTWSAWIKRSGLDTEQHLFGAPDAANCQLYLSDAGSGSVNNLTFRDNSTNYLVTQQRFRDVGAWYHLVITWDSSNATAGDRVRLYVNGERVTAFSSSSNPTLNATSSINSTSTHYLGQFNGGGNYYYDGYMTQINFVDGQALTPSSFGETNAQTGVWQPKAYSGSYGTNGFYLNFSDNSNTTAATLGKDYSGNGNNWTPNNFSVTAGAGNDSLVDSPTSYGTDTGVGGTVRGNYCTWNPVLQADFWATPVGKQTLTNGNLDASGNGQAAFTTFEIPNNLKVYYEITWSSIGSEAAVLISAASRDTFELSYLSNGQKELTGNTRSSYGASWTNGDIIGVAIDRANNTATFYKNGTSQGAITHTFTTATVLGGIYGGSSSVNFGQRPFAYTAPSGYKALCTQNLPTPTIGATTATQAGKYFDVTLYTGTASTQTIANSAGFAPDLVWAKNRSNTANNMLANKLSGNNLYLKSNTTDAESAINVQLVSNGFTTSGVGADINASGNTYVAWQWKANGSGSTNTSGSITSTVSANTTSGFSVLTYTGTGTAATIGHGLGVAPSMLIFKSRSNGSENWNVYHKSLGASTNILLNSTIAAFTDAAFLNATAPTSTVLSVGGAGSTGTNQGSATFVCYAFAEVAGYSKFGSYTGNGSSDGVFIYLGFRPKYVMIKCSSSGTGTGTWWINDSVRSPSNVVDNRLAASDSNAEQTGIGQYDFVSNGIKIRDSNIAWNGSGYTYIFMAFAESPFKYALAR